MLKLKIFFSLALTLCMLSAFAQDEQMGGMDAKAEKAIKKEWKKRAKGYVKDPLALKEREEYCKSISDINTELTMSKAELEKQVEQLTADLQLKASMVSSLQSQMQEMQMQPGKSKDTKQNENDESTTKPSHTQKPSKTKSMDGLVFKVQIGAFENFNLGKYAEGTEGITTEEDAKLNKYTLGSFGRLQVAEDFKKDIVRMGLKDAWVVPYLNGNRIEMKEALKMLKP